jgi:GTPase SAR1 family protein
LRDFLHFHEHALLFHVLLLTVRAFPALRPAQIGNVEMTEQEIEEFREVFELVDKDKGGAIEADEVRVNRLRQPFYSAFCFVNLLSQRTYDWCSTCQS